MASSKKTPYYNLSQFQDADKPSWRGDYNGDMDKIDTGIRDAKDTAIEARRTANDMDAKIENVKNTYISKVSADEKYATKTSLNDTKNEIETNLSDTKNEIETNANNTFVTKSVYNENIAKKADKTSVYTKTESDEKFALKTANTETQSQLDALATLTRPLTSWAAYAHPANDQQESISTSNASPIMLYPTAIKTNGKYVTYTANDGHFTFKGGSYLIMARGRLNHVTWSDSQKRNLRAQFSNMNGGADITFDDCKDEGDNQEYSMWGLLRVPTGETVTAAMHISYWTPPSGVTATFKIEEASIAIILLQSETYNQ